MKIGRVRGDATGLDIPVHAAALRAAGAGFLTRAFQAFGAIAPGNAVARVLAVEPCPGGSTGHKLFLSVEYLRPEPGLHTELFVKFSRDFDDALRDRGRHEMESEVRFAAISRLPGFPIRVPTAYFADYHQATGSGILVTQRICFGRDGIEPQHPKCLDADLDDPLAYYRLVLRSLARLAAAHRAGRLAPDIDTRFPFDHEAAIAADRIPHDAAQLRALVRNHAEFATRHPQLLPAVLRTPDFIARLERDALRILEHETAIKRLLYGNPALMALCHWNAQPDNAWFWRDERGERQCGLLDWGRVRQLNIAFSFWGAVSSASLDIWEHSFDELLRLFADEYQAHGGPRVDVEELRLHMLLYAAVMVIAWLMDAPWRVLHRLPEAAQASGPHDPMFRRNESARSTLHVYTVLLWLWQRYDLGACLDRVLARAAR